MYALTGNRTRVSCLVGTYSATKPLVLTLYEREYHSVSHSPYNKENNQCFNCTSFVFCVLKKKIKKINICSFYFFKCIFTYANSLNCTLCTYHLFVMAKCLFLWICKAFVPEWSKGADLSSAIERCVGSNPTGCIFVFFT